MPIRVAGAQIDLVVGDLTGNEERIADAMDWAEEEGADVLLLPELAVTGYPPEDLVLRPGFVSDTRGVLDRLAARSGRVATVVGFVDRVEGGGGAAGFGRVEGGGGAAGFGWARGGSYRLDGWRHRGGLDAVPRRVANAAAVVSDGEIQGIYHKVLLPNYGVFDEDRTFAVGVEPGRTFEIAGVRVGVSICEDIWLPDGPPAEQAANGAQVLLNINGSPFHRGKATEREAMLAERARAAEAPVVYLNLVGGQDELVFDGASLVLDAEGRVVHRSPQFVEDRFVVDVPLAGEATEPCCVAPLLGAEEEIYRALTIGVRDYVTKNGFSQVVVGLSGGIDSALTATICADALGPDRVWGISMPSRYSSEGSVSDSCQLAANLGIRFDVVPMDEVFGAFLDVTAPLFGDTEPGIAEENLQARTRGAILMAVSNKFGPMVVATGNKSELAAGYATLYGDMVGGYAALKDVFKTVVYELARWRNRDGEVIPAAIIEKPPSAELRPDQRDSDSLPAYELLDGILERYIEADQGVEEIAAAGYDRDLVLQVARMVDRNEYKRRQAAPGVKITTKAFGRDRRLPITNHYRRR